MTTVNNITATQFAKDVFVDTFCATLVSKPLNYLGKFVEFVPTASLQNITINSSIASVGGNIFTAVFRKGAGEKSYNNVLAAVFFYSLGAFVALKAITLLAAQRGMSLASSLSTRNFMLVFGTNVGIFVLRFFAQRPSAPAPTRLKFNNARILDMSSDEFGNLAKAIENGTFQFDGIYKSTVKQLFKHRLAIVRKNLPYNPGVFKICLSKKDRQFQFNIEKYEHQLDEMDINRNRMNQNQRRTSKPDLSINNRNRRMESQRIDLTQQNTNANLDDADDIDLNEDFMDIENTIQPPKKPKIKDSDMKADE